MTKIASMKPPVPRGKFIGKQTGLQIFTTSDFIDRVGYVVTGAHARAEGMIRFPLRA